MCKECLRLRLRGLCPATCRGSRKELKHAWSLWKVLVAEQKERSNDGQEA